MQVYHHPMRMPSFLMFGFAGACLALAGCVQHLDPTEIFNPPPPLAHGVNLTVYYNGDSNNKPVINVWVADGGGGNIRTLLTTDGSGQYSCAAPNFCSCEGTGGGGLGYWSLFCAAQTAIGSSTQLTDGNSHATTQYPFSIPLYFGWDWLDRYGSSTAGTGNFYRLHAEVSGYYYGGVPGEASIDVYATASGNGINAYVDGTGHWLKISADWTQ